jgi:uncharacterized OB-fold protein
MSPARTPVVEGLFTDGAGGPRLVGSRCTTCRTPYFPKSPICHNPACTASAMEAATFGPHGTIWSLAIQDYPPPPPVKYDEPYQRYAMAVVDLDDGLRVLGRIATDDPDAVQCDEKVEMIVDVLHHDAEGNEVTTWKFRRKAS